MIHCDFLKIMQMNVNEGKFTLMLSLKPLRSVNHILHICGLIEQHLHWQCQKKSFKKWNIYSHGEDMAWKHGQHSN